MSRSIHKSWIRNLVEELLASPVPDSICSKLKTTRCVQIISCNEESRCITISDTDYSVQAFLTVECFEGLVELYSIDTLKYSQVNLVNFCFTTVTQVAGNQDMKKLMSLPVTFPLALHCFKIDYLGASDCNVIGSPTPLNACSNITTLLRKFNYPQLKQRLAVVQFPIHKCLPDWEGAFESPDLFSAEKPLTREMFLQPESQLRVIQALNSFDLSHAICALPALLLDEESGNDGRPEPTTVVDGAGASRTKATSAEPSGTQTSSVGHYDFTADGWTETIREDDGDGDYDAERKDWSSHWTPMGEHTQLPSDGEESESDPEGAALQDRDFPPASDDDEASRASGRVTRSSCRAFSAGDMEILPHNHSTKAPSAAARRLDTGTQWTQDMTQASQLFSQLLSSETAASVASDGTSPVRTRRQRSASQQSNSSATNSPSGKNGGASQRSMTASANKRPGSSQGSSKTALPAIPEDMSPGGQTADSLSLVSTQSSSQTPVVLQDHRLLSLYQKLSKEQWAVGGQLASPSKIANPTEVAATSTVGRTLSSSSSSSTVSHANAASAPPSQSASAVAMSCPAPALPPTRPAARQIADSAAWGGASTWTGEELSQQSLSLSLSQSQSQFLSLSHNSLQASGELKTSSSSSGGAPGSKGGNWLTRQQPYITQDELGSLLEWGTEDASQFIFPLDDSAAEDPEHSAVAAPATATAGAEASNTAPSSSNSSSFVCVDIVHTANASAESTDGGSDSGGGAPISGITQDESPQPQQQIILTTQVNSTAPPTDTPQRPTKPPAQYSQSQLLSTSAASQQSDSYREPSAPTPIVMINDGVSGRNAAMKRGRPVQLSTLRTASDAAAMQEANALLHRSINRVFRDGNRYSGTISSYEDGMFLVVYEDGDQQHLSLREVKKWLVPLAAVSSRSAGAQHGGLLTRNALNESDSEGDEVGSQAEVLTAPQYPSSSAHSASSSNSDAHPLSSASRRAPVALAAESHAFSSAGIGFVTGGGMQIGRPPLGSSAPRTHISAAAVLLYSQDRGDSDNGDNDDAASITSESLGLRNKHPTPHNNNSSSSGGGDRSGSRSNALGILAMVAGQKRSATSALGSDGGVPTNRAGNSSSKARVGADSSSDYSGATGAAATSSSSSNSSSGSSSARSNVALMSNEQLEQYCRTLLIPAGMVMPPLSDYGFNYFDFLRHLPTLVERARARAEGRQEVASPPQSPDSAHRKTWNFRSSGGIAANVLSSSSSASGSGSSRPSLSGAASSSSSSNNPKLNATTVQVQTVDISYYATMTDEDIAQRFPRPAQARHARMQRSIQRALLHDH